MPEVRWQELSFTAPARRKSPARPILVEASGHATSGDGPEGGIVALMGASGSGKSTLLGFLAARAVPDSGELRLDGRAYDAVTSVRVGYVPQHDRLFSTLTVFETLKLGATLRGRRASPAAADPADDARIETLLRTLRLGAAKSTPIGEATADAGARRGISGGERKRTAIGLELLHAPPLLVLDEPTSGLDSAAATDVMAALATLTGSQAVVVSLHQPSTRTYNLVGQLGLLSPTGRTLYFGRAADAVAHYAALGAPVPPLTSATEHFLDVIADAFAEPPADQGAMRAKLEKRAGAIAEGSAAARRAAGGATPPAAAAVSVPFGRQASALLWRAKLQNRRHPAFSRAMLSRSITMALVMGYLYSGLSDTQQSVQDRVGALYFVLTNQIMTSIASMRTFLAERAIAEHELASGLYALPAYFVARSFAESLWQLGGGLLFGSLTYALVGFAPSAAQLGFFLVVVCLVTLCAESYVVLVGALMPDEKSATVVGPLILALFMVSGGLFVNSASVPFLFQLFNRINMFTYGFSALLQNEMDGLVLRCEPHELVGPPPPTSVAEKAVAAAVGGAWPSQRCPVRTGAEVVDRMAMGVVSPLSNALALAALFCAFRVLAFLALRRRFARPRPRRAL